MNSNQLPQRMIIIPIIKGLCFSMVEASRM
jgi:hypothetical protein